MRYLVRSFRLYPVTNQARQLSSIAVFSNLPAVNRTQKITPHQFNIALSLYDRRGEDEWRAAKKETGCKIFEYL
jgi:hypothetical protein